ncbi:hypothetical protein [Mycolicibacterium sediminis]|uniref:Integral membrane protein n=1 Tax=Mycolicibacterium sediminis TaxID=1286180 RepID=A0A7I7QQN3_9MYCO|nr:hypothetical protein [Mycolicibacterium sediminis]BBY28699.1 hypothetical protein MSEDJ_27950 [Mycolicibacterium sediminis]
MIVPSPATVRQAGGLVALEGVALVGMAVAEVVLYFRGSGSIAGFNGLGTALWFAVMGSAVLAAAWALWTGRRWGRGLAVFAQLLLLPVAYYMAVGSGQWSLGIPVAVVAAATLVLLFSRSALEWLSYDPASADNSGPETR